MSPTDAKQIAVRYKIAIAWSVFWSTVAIVWSVLD